VDIPKRTILLCEDDQNLRQLLRVVLGGGYRFLEATNGDEAIKLALEERPDLVILDLMLPKLSGLDVLARLRTEPAAGRPRVIVMSAWADAEDAALAAGADRFIAKPFELDDLSDIVRETLDGS
jgi:DNA-binding response OmpR family regulator